MHSTMQPSLFGDAEAPAVTASLFAEIVFDRPLDHALHLCRAATRCATGSPSASASWRRSAGATSRPSASASASVEATAGPRRQRRSSACSTTKPLLTPDLLRLTRWMADYYLCGWGQVLNAVVPAGARDQAGTRTRTFLEAVPGGRTAAPAADADRRSRPPSWSSCATRRQAHRAAAVWPDWRSAAPAPIEALVAQGPGPPRRAARRPLHRHAGASRSSRRPTGHAQRRPASASGTPLEPALRSGGFQAFLLHGVTGSGKTEIYLRAIEEVVRQGKEALVLVPEISLTPQTIAAFRGRCGEVAVLHSHLGDAERGGHWRRVAGGQGAGVVGARSAVFAPTRKLGLIVIDEEHESSFKQEATPRYHARDVAVMRARLENIPILLGSATPSLESWHNAERGQYTLLTLAAARARSAAAAGRPDRPAPRAASAAAAPAPQPDAGTGHAAGARRRRPGDVAAQSPRLFDARPLPGVRPRRAVPVLRPGADLSHASATSMLCHYCGYEQAAAQKCPHVRPGGGALPGPGHGETAGGDRGEVSRARRAADGQRHDAAARQPSHACSTRSATA